MCAKQKALRARLGERTLWRDSEQA